MDAEQGAVVMDATSVQPTDTQGLPGEDDRIVRELDVYLMQGELGQGVQTYLLQFPLRPPWRPYHTEYTGLENVKLKHKVKKLQCEVPLDTSSRNYNASAEPSRKISSVTLQSARLDQRTSFAAGFVENDRLLLVPIDEALQLRPSLAHLDKEKEETAAAKKRQQAGEEEEAKLPELMQLTVQVKRRETEQQMESRLRSYAHLAAQEEADPWLHLEYHGEGSELAATVWEKLANVEGKGDVPATLSREQYLEAIVPGSSTLHSQEMASRAAGVAPPKGLGRPASGADAAAPDEGGGGGQQQAEVAISEDLHPTIVAVTMVLLKMAQVVNIDAIRGMLARQQDVQLKGVADGASDATLHAAVLSTGDVTHLRKSYFPTRLGNTALDPLRKIVIELLKEQEQLRRSDVVEAAKVQGLAVSDTLYSKVIKELCTSRGSIWTLKG